MFITISDIKSVYRKLYAKQGTEVTIIAEHGNVLIVQNMETGVKFSVTKEKIMAIETRSPEPEVIIGLPVKIKFEFEPVKKKNETIQKKAKQQTLF